MRFEGEEYRFGFNGQERDNEIYGFGNSYTAEYWQYDSRLGRRWNVDPVYKHDRSNFSTFSNNPIWFIDPNGDNDYTVNKETGKTEFYQENKLADNYYVVGKEGITRDDDGKITNELMITTKPDALKKDIQYGSTEAKVKGELRSFNTQTLDFGDNSKEAEDVFKAISTLTNKEFTLANYTGEYIGGRGKNEVYTSHHEQIDAHGSQQSIRRYYQLERHVHYHPRLGHNSPLARDKASPEDIEFKNKIFDYQDGVKVNRAQFYIFTEYSSFLIRYTND